MNGKYGLWFTSTLERSATFDGLVYVLWLREDVVMSYFVSENLLKQKEKKKI